MISGYHHLWKPPYVYIRNYEDIYIYNKEYISTDTPSTWEYGNGVECPSLYQFWTITRRGAKPKIKLTMTLFNGFLVVTCPKSWTSSPRPQGVEISWKNMVGSLGYSFCVGCSMDTKPSNATSDWRKSLEWETQPHDCLGDHLISAAKKPWIHWDLNLNSDFFWPEVFHFFQAAWWCTKNSKALKLLKPWHSHPWRGVQRDRSVVLRIPGTKCDL